MVALLMTISQTVEAAASAANISDLEGNMNIETLHIGMKVRHPQYGVGVVKSLTGQTAEIAFDDEQRTIAPASSDLQPAESTATLSELQMPLANLIRDTAHAVVEALGLEQQDALVEGLATRWQKGTLILQPAEPSLQPKEVPLETFFHKIVMIRNNLRVLEQKVNASDKLSDADKFDLQQYITRCYGSLTTFNILLPKQVGVGTTRMKTRPFFPSSGSLPSAANNNFDPCFQEINLATVTALNPVRKCEPAFDARNLAD